MLLAFNLLIIIYPYPITSGLLWKELYIGRTPLHEAVFMREIGNVRAILEEGGDVNARDQKGYTPLHIACKTGAEGRITKEIIKELVKAGAKVDQELALHQCITRELLEKLKELSERCDIEPKPKRKRRKKV